MIAAAAERQIDLTLAALADPTRRAILERLARGEARVTELAQPFRMSLNAVSKHLRTLERAGLVRRQIRGREHVISFESAPLDEASRWIEAARRFWTPSLDSLERYLDETAGASSTEQQKGGPK